MSFQPTPINQPVEKSNPEIIRLVKETCDAAVAELGRQGAEQIWRDALKRHSRKRGRPPQTELPRPEALFVTLCDYVLTNNPTEEEWEAHMDQTQYPEVRFHIHSPGAIAKKFRCLLKDLKAGKFQKEDKPGQVLPHWKRLRGN